MYNASIRPTTNHGVESDMEEMKRKIISLIVDTSDA